MADLKWFLGCVLRGLVAGAVTAGLVWLGIAALFYFIETMSQPVGGSAPGDPYIPHPWMLLKIVAALVALIATARNLFAEPPQETPATPAQNDRL